MPRRMGILDLFRYRCALPVRPSQDDPEQLRCHISWSALSGNRTIIRGETASLHGEERDYSMVLPCQDGTARQEDTALERIKRIGWGCPGRVAVELTVGRGEAIAIEEAIQRSPANA